MATTTDDRDDERFDRDLAEDLEALEYQSHGTVGVSVEITRVERVEDQRVRVHFEPPIGDEFGVTMELSPDPNADAGFSRLLHALGYNYSNAEGIVGERIGARYDGDSWTIPAIEPERSLRDWLPASPSAQVTTQLISIGIVGLMAYILVAQVPAEYEPMPPSPQPLIEPVEILFLPVLGLLLMWILPYLPRP